MHAVRDMEGLKLETEHLELFTLGPCEKIEREQASNVEKKQGRQNSGTSELMF